MSVVIYSHFGFFKIVYFIQLLVARDAGDFYFGFGYFLTILLANW